MISVKARSEVRRHRADPAAFLTQTVKRDEETSVKLEIWYVS